MTKTGQDTTTAFIKNLRSEKKNQKLQNKIQDINNYSATAHIKCNAIKDKCVPLFCTIVAGRNILVVKFQLQILFMMVCVQGWLEKITFTKFPLKFRICPLYVAYVRFAGQERMR